MECQYKIKEKLCNIEARVLRPNAPNLCSEHFKLWTEFLHKKDEAYYKGIYSSTINIMFIIYILNFKETKTLISEDEIVNIIIETTNRTEKEAVDWVVSLRPPDIIKWQKNNKDLLTYFDKI